MLFCISYNTGRKTLLSLFYIPLAALKLDTQKNIESDEDFKTEMAICSLTIMLTPFKYIFRDLYGLFFCTLHIYYWYTEYVRLYASPMSSDYGFRWRFQFSLWYSPSCTRALWFLHTFSLQFTKYKSNVSAKPVTQNVGAIESFLIQNSPRNTQIHSICKSGIYALYKNFLSTFFKFLVDHLFAPKPGSAMVDFDSCMLNWTPQAGPISSVLGH